MTQAKNHRLASCEGEHCTLCGAQAEQKVEEVIFYGFEPGAAAFAEEPGRLMEMRHPLSAYLCQSDFERIFKPYEHEEQWIPRVIRTEAQYKLAMERIEALVSIDPPAGTGHAELLEMLAILITEYERVHYPLGEAPSESTVARLTARLLNQSEDLVKARKKVGALQPLLEAVIGWRTEVLRSRTRFDRVMGLTDGEAGIMEALKALE